ncbi:carboxymethylenebutenolidase [Geosmithia morbida]|uniref:Carboxymethylenebutenolidase n=1 Tax=Geosmithia morbida TaxID=1094350 RepID=A0A9P4YZ61_9HYPO|nr:carboxymethylenebutenolidase [Geosmithia morbida]KAF4124436.1 carboxymethylenebutenolidase [Geosmithia morbida]
MFQDITEPPAPAPTPHLQSVQDGISLLHPLLRSTRTGPGLVIISPDLEKAEDQLATVQGVPSPILKWAEEGYTVIEVQRSILVGDAAGAIQTALAALSRCDVCQPKGKVGLAERHGDGGRGGGIGYTPDAWNQVASCLSDIPDIVAAVTYTTGGGQTETETSTPTLRHVAGVAGANPSRKKGGGLTEYHYPQVESHLFAVPFRHQFHYVTETLSHTRNLTFLKPRMGGPYFDLESIWDEHTYYEFADRSVEHTMSTMVAEPYVNHVPTLTGGVGRERLSRFYRDNFIFNNSADTSLDLVSRTLGIDRVIDEFIFNFTHDKELDWLVPGLPPTGKRVQVPFTAVVNIRGDRLYHEHIAWDQGTVLRQLGLLPEYLPYTGPLPGGRQPAPGKRFEYRVPVGGVETADKMRDRNSVPSNAMFTYALREV